MAELEDVTLDGKPLHSLRVADLKAALEQRGLAKSGQKNALIKRLKGALMLENLQRSSTQHIGLQPNSQIGEEMSQNSFIKQYLAKQQELLRQRLEREAREATEADDTHSPDGPDEDDHTPTKDSASFLAEKHHIVHSHLSVTQAGGGGLPQDPGLMGSHRLDTGPVPVSQESSDTKTSRIWHPSLPPGHEEVATPSPPRAVASLSVRVVGQPERQGLPLMMPRSQEREGTAPVEAGPAQSVLQLSRSARAAASAQVESDDDDEDDDESDDDDEWGPSSHGKKNVRAPPVHPPPAAAPQRSRRKLQPPQHIPPQPQPVHHPPPLQLRHPTPPPSPPPELSFPLPDTPKQSPHDQDEPPGLAEAAAAAPGAGLVSAQSLTRQESSSSSRSSSPEPPSTRRPGPLSLLVRKMESEGEFEGAQKAGMEGEGVMEVEEQEDGEEAVQVSAQKVIGSDVLMPVPTVPPAQQDAQEIEAEKDRNVQTRNEEKEKKEVDKTSAPLRLTVSSPRRPEMFSAVPPPESLKSPSKPEQVSGLTSIPKCSKEVAMETEASTAMSESKNEEDKEVNVLKKETPQESPKMTEESKKALKLPHTTSKQGDVDESGDHTQKDKAERHSSTSSQSSSDSDSESASSRSSSSPSQEKSSPPRQNKDEEKKIRTDVKKEKAQSSREVKQEALSEPAGQVAMELEGHSHSESTIQQSDHQGADMSNSRPEESSAGKSYAARKISLSSKTEIASSESETVGGASRKRRWGSSTAVTAKKPSISITTESLKTLIPDIKPLQEAVVELHPDEGRLSADEDSSGPREREEPEEDQGLKIRRTVTQIVPSDGHENGQKEMEEDEEEDEDDEEPKHTGEEKEKPRKQESSPDVSMEAQEEDSNKVTPSDSLVRRSISQQKSGVSITIDDPIRTGRQLSPPHGKTSNIIHVRNLVRPFTLGQLKLLLNRTGALVEEGFWIDKIKSHCYVTYSTTEEAVATREALHGVKWPASNPKVLRVDFCEQDELDFHKGLITSDRTGEGHDPQSSGASGHPVTHPHPQPPPPNHEKEKERDRERNGGATAVRDQWAEREKAMERRERTRSEREWDRDKVKDFGRDDRDKTRRSRSRDRRRRERGKSKEKRTEKKDKPEEPPVKLLDDLFHKTKAAPCIYWLPLTEEQATQRALERAERIKEREKIRKEIQEEEDKKREERRERAKGREGGNTGAAGAGVARRSNEGERDRAKERERERAREAEKRRDGHRGRGSDSKPTGGSRRSRSRSNTSRDRRH